MREPDDLRPLPLVPVQRELRPLVQTLNHFTERLRMYWRSQMLSFYLHTILSQC